MHASKLPYTHHAYLADYRKKKKCLTRWLNKILQILSSDSTIAGNQTGIKEKRASKKYVQWTPFPLITIQETSFPSYLFLFMTNQTSASISYSLIRDCFVRSLIILIVMSSAVDMIFAQFKVIKMESLRSLASSHDHHHHHQAPHIAASAVNEKGKPAMTKDSNVTVIQVLPRERLHRRTDKVIRRRIDAPLASDFKVLTPREPTDAKLMKLHIINVRTGKIQDAIMLAPSSHSNHLDDNHPKAKSVHRASGINSH